MLWLNDDWDFVQLELEQKLTIFLHFEIYIFVNGIGFSQLCKSTRERGKMCDFSKTEKDSSDRPSAIYCKNGCF